MLLPLIFALLWVGAFALAFSVFALGVMLTYALPFIGLSLLGFLFCISSARYRGLSPLALVIPVTFGFFSITGTMLAFLLATMVIPGLLAFHNLLLTGIFACIYCLCGAVGALGVSYGFTRLMRYLRKAK